MGKERSTIFNSLLIYFITLLIFVCVRILVIVIDFPFDDTILDYVSSIFVQVGIMFLFPVIMFTLLQKQKFSTTFSNFNFRKVSVITIFLSILIGFACYFFNIAIANFFGSVIRIFGYEDAPSMFSSSGSASVTSFVFEVLFVAVLPAICEETLHRGLLLKGLSSMGIERSVILSSVLFGLMHMNVNQLFYTAILGFIIALSVVIAKSIIPAMIIHFMNNFLSVYFSYASTNHWFGENVHKFIDEFLSSNNLISFFFSSFFALAIVLAVIVILFIFLLKETRIKKVKTMLDDIAKINKEYNSNETLNTNQNVSNLYNLNSLMSQYNIKGLSSMVFTELEIKKTKLSTIERILLIFCFVVGGLVTAFTFIWGML